MVLDFDMLCGKGDFYASLITTFQLGGVVIGSVLFGQISDTFGRKKVDIGVLVALCFFGGLSVFANSWAVLAAFRFICGILWGGIVIIHCAYTYEMIPTEQRMFFTGVFNWGWTRTSGTLICFLLPHWRHATMAVSMVCAPAVLIIAVLMPESPKWSHSMGRLEEMNKTLEWLAKFNKEAPPLTMEQPIEEGEASPLEVQSTVPRQIYTIKDLFRTRKMRTVTLTLMKLRDHSKITSDFGTSSIQVFFEKGAGNFWVDQFLFGGLLIVSEPVLFFVDFYCPGFNRRHLHLTSQFLVVLSYSVIVILVSFNLSIGVVVVNLIGTIFIDYTWDACSICGAEGFPTMVRALGMGTCTLVARIGAMLAPQMTYLADFWNPAPFLTVVIVGLVSLIVSGRFLRDTKGKELEDTFTSEDNSSQEKVEEDRSEERERLIQTEVEEES